MPYSVDLQAFGGKKPYSWSGSLPTGLALGRSGLANVISGTPLGVGDRQVTLAVEDNGPTPATVTRTFVLGVDRAVATLVVTAPAAAQVGSPIPVAVSVIAEGNGAPSGGITVGTGDGAICTLAAPGGSCMITFVTAGSGSITATYAGDANFDGGAPNTTVVTVGTAPSPPAAAPEAAATLPGRQGQRGQGQDQAA